MKRLLIFGIGLGCMMMSPLLAQSKTRGQLFFCVGDSRSWDVHESAQPGMFDQEIELSGLGTYTLTMKANGFGFKGYSYTRPSAWDKWKIVQQTDMGKHIWTKTWQVYNQENHLGLLQFIKDNNTCRGCTMTLTMSTSNCPVISHEEDARNFGLASPQTQLKCKDDTCYTRETGPLSCMAHEGWDGSQCPY